MHDPQHTPELVQQALTLQGAPLGQLLLSLRPVLTARAGRTLARHRRLARAAAIEVPDAVQEMTLRLLERDGQWLRSWDPARGMSLPSWVGLLGERALRTLLLRSTQAALLSSAAIDPERQGSCSIAQLEARDLLSKAALSLDPTSRARELLLLEALQAPLEDAGQLAARLGISTEALYCARSRLLRRLRAAAGEEIAPSADEHHAQPPRELRRAGKQLTRAERACIAAP
jgi:hypothetical protein